MLVPFTLRLTPPVRLLLLSLSDDPGYTDLEVQWVDDPAWGGSGAVVLAVRHDGTADVHVDQRLRVSRADYEIGAGVAAFTTTPMAPCRFDITDTGAQVELGLVLADGRSLSLTVHEARRAPRPLVRMLAPAGHAMRAPTFFPFFWMEDIWFLRWRGARVRVRVDGHDRAVTRVGAPWRLARYAREPMTALWCEAGTVVVPSVPDVVGEHRLPAALDPVAGEPGDGRVGEPSGAATASVAVVDGRPVIASVGVRRGRQSLEVRFDPPVPDVTSLPTLDGRWTAWASGRAQFGGRWRARRHDGRVELALTVDEPWDPGPQPRLASLVFGLLRVFRTWPTTYRWDATIDLDSDGPTLSGQWSRTTA